MSSPPSYEELMIRGLLLAVELNELRKQMDRLALAGEELPSPLLERWDTALKELKELTKK